MFRSRLATAASFGRGLEFRRPVTVRVWQIFMKIWSLCLDVDDWPITLKARDLRGTRPQPRLPRAGLATHSRKNVSTKVAFCFLSHPPTILQTYRHMLRVPLTDMLRVPLITIIIPTSTTDTNLLCVRYFSFLLRGVCASASCAIWLLPDVSLSSTSRCLTC